MKHLIITFKSRNDTLSFYNTLKSRNFICSIINTPKVIGSSCSLSIKTGVGYLSIIRSLLNLNNAKIFIYEPQLNYASRIN